MKHKIIHSDCIKAMHAIKGDSIDSCVTDPPYGLEFMGKEWDKFNALSFQEFTYRWATELYRVLKPGAHILVFGGTRTYHRMACAIEDAGFEVRDMIEWFYGSGFPKSLDLGEGKGTGLKPAHESILWGTKPLYTVTSLYNISDKICLLESDARGAKRYLKSSQAERKGETCDSARWNVEGKYNILENSNEVMDISRLGVKTVNTALNTILLWKNIWGGFLNLLNKSTISIKSEMTTDLKILNSLLSAITLQSIIQGNNQVNGKKSVALTVENHLNALYEKLNATLTPFVQEVAISRGRKRHQVKVGGGFCPCNEPIVLARKPITEKNIVSNVLKHGTGGINVDMCRVGLADQNVQGRFPANLILECCCEEDELMGGIASITTPRSKNKHGSGGAGTYSSIKESGEHYKNEEGGIHTNPKCVCKMLDKQSGQSKSACIEDGANRRAHQEHKITNPSGWEEVNRQRKTEGFNDNGGASRFFYQAKASQKERWFYCKFCKRSDQNKNRDKHIHNAPSQTRYKHIEFHPTQKPIQLIQYLIKLITPINKTTIDPFLGSGTALIAAEREQVNCIGIDSHQPYCNIAYQRLKDEIGQVTLTDNQSTISTEIGFI